MTSKGKYKQDSDGSYKRNTAMYTTDMALFSTTANKQAGLPAHLKFTYVQVYVHETQTSIYTWYTNVCFHRHGSQHINAHVMPVLEENTSRPLK